TIFSVIATIGVPTGVQRFLGKLFAEQKIQDANVFIKSSLVLVTIGLFACLILIIITKDFFHNIFNYHHSLMLVFFVLIISLSMYNLFRSIIISSLKTRMLPIITLVSTSLKIVLGIILVLTGMGVLGMTIGFILFPILASILFFITLKSILRSTENRSDIKIKNSIKETLSSSLANWIPTLVTTIGSQLGTIIVFGSQGASHAGIYFIAFSIFTAIAAITSVLLSISYPALSAMKDGRKTFAWRVTKMSLIATLPISTSIIFYSRDIMHLFGQEYVDGAISLQLLLVSSLPAVVTSGINSLIYSRGNYKQVLVMGLASSIPRVLLYFILVPVYGSTGAAISYTAGSFFGFVISVLFARTVGLKIFWKELFLILIVPTGLGFVLSYAGINYVVGIVITCIVSCILYVKMQIITRNDIHDSISGLPSKIANPTLRILNNIAKKLNEHF
ncbi:MAG TPA: polysaccharide biosynthesis C-terminal domain-containing protein, partial [Candidatus Bathyarchaeia archaeon]|nr:polysaccharide biosynthesis C-terminal domain-containing protein [Candidatus Bathyarchaeia archaeon]